MSISNKYAYQTRYLNSLPPKQNAIPVYLRMSNSSAEVVLRERKVEIKDLESRITYLQNQIKDLKIENKTLKDVQSRHEKELRKFKEGVADIPSLMRSHKEEIKALESNISSQRRELRECQKELKSKCDIILRKDQQFEKISSISKRNEKHLQELHIENKELKSEKKKLDEECKKLLNGNEEFKSKNERLQKKVQQMSNRILDLEESLGSAEHQKTQLKEDMAKLQKNFEELQQNFALLKCHAPLISTETQTESLINVTDSSFEDTNTSCQIEKEINVGALLYADKDNIIKKKNYTANDDGIINNQSTTKCENTIDLFGGHSLLSFRTEAKEQRFLLEPLKPRLPFTTKMLERSNAVSSESNNDEKSRFSFKSPYSSSNIFESQCPLKNTESRISSEDKFSEKGAVKNTCDGSVLNSNNCDTSENINYDYSFYDLKVNDSCHEIL